jgi:hypothetical protein
MKIGLHALTPSLIKGRLILLILLLAIVNIGNSQYSMARVWCDATLFAIRKDFARPPVHARNLHHISVAMYECWAVYQTEAETYIFGKDSLLTCKFVGIPKPFNLAKDRDIAISFAAYRIIEQRFKTSPNYALILEHIQSIMNGFNYDYKIVSTDYKNGSPARLGNAIAKCILDHGLADGSNEKDNYAIRYYKPKNKELEPQFPGNPNLVHINNWQPLKLKVAVDQNGNPIPSLQKFQSPEWGSVLPFALKNPKQEVRDSLFLSMYHDPGILPKLDTINKYDLSSQIFKRGMEMVIAWSSHLTPEDSLMIDISPNSIGNVKSLPNSPLEYDQFYDFNQGGDAGKGYPINPVTKQPYTPQFVKRSDFQRIVSQFWADGPNTETPPGHWFEIYNKLVANRLSSKKFNGKGNDLQELEYDLKAYFLLGAAVHDAAISAWGIKGWYDGVRPISAIRYMAKLGQCTDTLSANYHPGGLDLIPDLIETVQIGDGLAGPSNINVGKIKLKTWRGHSFIRDPLTDYAGVGWILAEDWFPYQEPTFVTPPFAGYVSGHSTFSRAAAEILKSLTGSDFFPEGIGSYKIDGDNRFIKFERTPEKTLSLEWATFEDAANQSAMSRIWGGIHPPFDDIPGREIGLKVAIDVFSKAKDLFYKDEDQDQYYSFEDCNDLDPTIHPFAVEYCDGKDNDCDGMIDDSTRVLSYFIDRDRDHFGDPLSKFDTCGQVDLSIYVLNGMDCNDLDSTVNPKANEICDTIDNNCNSVLNENLKIYTFFKDNDRDHFGDPKVRIDTCLSELNGFIENDMDCNDQDSTIHPRAIEIVDGKDNDCDGFIDNITALQEESIDITIYPNPVNGVLFIKNNTDQDFLISISDLLGVEKSQNLMLKKQKINSYNLSDFTDGMYIILFQTESYSFSKKIYFKK